MSNIDQLINAAANTTPIYGVAGTNLNGFKLISGTFEDIKPLFDSSTNPQLKIKFDGDDRSMGLYKRPCTLYWEGRA